jgi:hypothetical protein
VPIEPQPLRISFKRLLKISLITAWLIHTVSLICLAQTAFEATRLFEQLVQYATNIFSHMRAHILILVTPGTLRRGLSGLRHDFEHEQCMSVSPKALMVLL